MTEALTASLYRSMKYPSRDGWGTTWKTSWFRSPMNSKSPASRISISTSLISIAVSIDELTSATSNASPMVCVGTSVLALGLVLSSAS